MTDRLIGGILLIIGTSIGGGMLALPIANAATGFWASSGFLVLCWAAMTAGAFLILETNLYLPPGSNMVSMATATLGKTAAYLTWFVYLFLLYSLLSAYISGGADVMGSLFAKIHLTLNAWQSCLIFTLFFGSIVYSGIRKVDWFNRALMFGKLGAYILLVVLIAPNMQVQHLTEGDYHYASGTLMILIVSFGFAIIVPSLRQYFEDDITALKKAIFIGSLVPLFCYIAWDAVIMGSLPNGGDDGLLRLAFSERSTSDLSKIVGNTVGQGFISAIFNFFISISMLTAFLGVSLCLMSFLSDGLALRQEGLCGIAVFALTFSPPVLVVLYLPGAYLSALNFAGIFCVLLLLLLPALMAMAGRRRKLNAGYTVAGGNLSLWLLMSFATVLVCKAMINFFY